MRILFILENYYPSIGGVETLFKSLIDELDASGVECIVLTTRKHDLPKIVHEGNTTVVRYRFFSRYLFTFLAFFPAIKWGRNADLIHTTSYNAGLPASLAGVFLRKKVLITFHEVWGKLWFKLPFFSQISKFFHYLFEQMLLRMPFHRFIAVSEFTAARLIKHGVAPEKIPTIYNGIEYARWTRSRVSHTNENFRFIFYGRLGISKGLDLLLPAFAEIINANHKCELILVLPREPASQLKYVEQQIKHLPSESRPRILHELSHEKLVDEIVQSHCVVIPSYSEGFGYTAVESMALDMPIISSGSGSLKEVVGGNLIEMKEQSVEGLRDAMERALENDWEFREKQEFQLKDTVNNYLKLYDQLLEELIQPSKKANANE